MPTYEYVCKSCEHRFEKRQSFSANPLRTCPECGEKALQKVIFASGVVFKGSGFYVNDSKSDSSSKKSSSSSGSASSSDNGTAESTSKKKSDKGSSTKESAAATSDD